MPTAKIRISMNGVEVEYEGDEKFLKEDLLNTITELSKLSLTIPMVPETQNEKHVSVNQVGGREGQLFDQSTDTIANLTKASAGPALLMAAAAHLAFIKQQDTFSRQEILSEMKSAVNHFKETYRKNLTGSLKTLMGNDKIRLVSAGTYALSATEKSKMEAILVADGN